MTSSKMAAPIKHVHARAHGRRHLDDVIAGSANHSRPSDDVIAAILEHVVALRQSGESAGTKPPATGLVDCAIVTTNVPQYVSPFSAYISIGCMNVAK